MRHQCQYRGCGSSVVDNRSEGLGYERAFSREGPLDARNILGRLTWRWGGFGWEWSLPDVFLVLPCLPFPREHSGQWALLCLSPCALRGQLSRDQNCRCVAHLRFGGRRLQLCLFSFLRVKSGEASPRPPLRNGMKLPPASASSSSCCGPQEGGTDALRFP